MHIETLQEKMQRTCNNEKGRFLKEEIVENNLFIAEACDEIQSKYAIVNKLLTIYVIDIDTSPPLKGDWTNAIQ